MAIIVLVQTLTFVAPHFFHHSHPARFNLAPNHAHFVPVSEPLMVAWRRALYPTRLTGWSHLEFVTTDLKRALHLAWQPCHIRLLHQLSHCSRHHGQIFLLKFLILLPSPYFSMEILLLNQLKESSILGQVHLFS